MLKPTLTYQKEETVIVIRIGLVKTPEEMGQLSGELRDLCEEITFSPDIRVVVLTGADKNSFSIEPEAWLRRFRKRRRAGDRNLVSH